MRQATAGAPPSDDQVRGAFRRFVDDSVCRDAKAPAQRQIYVEMRTLVSRPGPTVRGPPRSYAEAVARQPLPRLHVGQSDCRVLSESSADTE